MKRLSLEDYLQFEKSKRRKLKQDDEFDKRRKLFSEQEIKLLESQVFGSIHTIEDIKIPYFHKKDSISRDYYGKTKIRPGVVITSPSEETNFETEWLPMTSKTYGRNPLKTVLLLKIFESVKIDSVLLLDYRCWFKFKSLSERKGFLSYNKQKELEEKLKNFQSLDLWEPDEN